MRIKSRFKTLEFLIQTRFYMAQTIIKNLGIHENLRECNVCGWKGKSFYVFYNEMFKMKDETLCPKCASCIYQRALAKYLQEEAVRGYPYKILEVSPHSSDPVGKSLVSRDYVSIDIVKGRAMVVMDLRNLTYPDNTFDLIICSAVLEHIKEDEIAMKEMYRVLKPQGICLIEIPMGYYKDPYGTHTVEFDGQPFYEHFRSYGVDFEDKMLRVGFKSRRIQYNDFNLGLENSSILGFYEGKK